MRKRQKTNIFCHSAKGMQNSRTQKECQPVAHIDKHEAFCRSINYRKDERICKEAVYQKASINEPLSDIIIARKPYPTIARHKDHLKPRHPFMTMVNLPKNI